MAKRNRQEWVSCEFSEYLERTKKRLNENGGKFTKADITRFLAAMPPQIVLRKKTDKEGTIFDF